MPSNLVKTPRQESLWKEAKRLATKNTPDNLYALTNHIYQQKKKKKGTGS